MNVHFDNNDSWRETLAAKLPTGLGMSPSFSLYSAIVEACHWADRAPSSAWARRDNARSLQADFETGLSMCGANLKKLFRPHGIALNQALEQVADNPRRDLKSKIASLSAASHQARAILQSPPLRVAAWQDIVNAARADSPEMTVIEPRITLLNAMLAGSGLDAAKTFQRGLFIRGS